jgi:hypothetical protein
MNLSIAVTVDVDNDGASLADARNRLSWQGLKLVPVIADIAHARGIPVTWFVRADPQLRAVYGSPSYLLEDQSALWRDLKGRGDEIGWHPHLVSLADDGSFRAERDERRQEDDLRSTCAELRARKHEFFSVRVGEAIGSNIVMHTLADLGLRVDSSAIPGRRRHDEARTFDWAPTPNVPYRPSVADYRVPGHPALPILEIPMTALPVHAPFDPGPLLRYANLAYRPAIFASALDRWFEADGRADTVLTLILHPDELMPGAQAHPLYAFAPGALGENLNTLFDAADRRGFGVAGYTMAALTGVVAAAASC